ncbi:acyltransferase [Bradyrhizobium tropiciagri]|uniref:acyltransferase family protein n=1 Tax=Bradyrhizobium tropiciagri TaxID=312253 RepID=UPI001BABD91B|nr:acyltransferase [Bradyrhizobium tropiciagri]MBR0871271.1 acyltransferase [Bradyrhizobium tropiciagri]
MPWLQFGYHIHDPTFVTWSLAIEEQFYLMLPVLIAALPRRWLIRVLWCGVLLAPPWRWALNAYLPHPTWVVMLPGRLDDLFGGVLIACFMRGYCQSRVGWAILALIAPLCDIVHNAIVDAPTVFSVVSLACCVAIMSAAATDRPVMLRPLIWMGRRCYALYLFHMLIFNAVSDLKVQWPALASFAIVCALAEISWRAIEAPLIGYAKRRFVRRSSDDGHPGEKPTMQDDFAVEVPRK